MEIETTKEPRGFWSFCLAWGCVAAGLEGIGWIAQGPLFELVYTFPFPFLIVGYLLFLPVGAITAIVTERVSWATRAKQAVSLLLWLLCLVSVVATWG